MIERTERVTKLLADPDRLRATARVFRSGEQLADFLNRISDLAVRDQFLEAVLPWLRAW